MIQKENNQEPPFLQRNKSIAVLPFVNMSSDPDNEYFSDGMTEEIINALTTVKGLKVISRTSSFAFKNKNIDVRNIGSQLGVSTILEGSVRKAKNRIRITAQLIICEDGSHLWSQNFDRELNDIFALQDEISLMIADQIRENFGHFDIQDNLVEAPTQNIEAYNLYLKARYHQLKWDTNNLKKAIEYYEQCTRLDPTFALAYLGAGLTYGIGINWGFIPYAEGFQAASQFLSEGFRLDNTSYLAHYAAATISFFEKWNFKEAYQNLTRAAELNPSFTDAEEGLAELYTAIGALDKAMHHADNILKLNPLSPNHCCTKANIHYYSGNYAEALENLHTALRIDPDFSPARETITLCHIQLKDYDKLDTFLTDNPQIKRPARYRALYSLMYPEENRVLNPEQLYSKEKTEPTFNSGIMNLYLLVYLKKYEEALDMLEEEIKTKTGQFINFQMDPFLVPLRGHARFQSLITRIFHPSKLPNAVLDTASKSDGAKPPLSEQETDKYLENLTTFLEEEKLYLNSDLCLKSLAEKIGLHPNKLSWLINESIGKNFNEYINSFRVETFKEKAIDPAYGHLTLLGLAYESGFNSKTTFNAFFKKTEGVTPRAWVKTHL